jgi:hypothetical protein
MSWFDDVMSGVESFVGDPLGQKVTSLGLSYLLNQSGLADPQIPNTGYQGQIPAYRAIRQQVPVAEGMELTSGAIRPMGTPAPSGLAALTGAQPTGRMVPMSYDPNRRPGSGGRRYFTDTIYAGDEGGVEAARALTEARAEELMRQNIANPARRVRSPSMSQPMAAGGIVGLKEGMYLDGETDGMADEVEAVIGEDQPAALSDGEYVIPADVVSHLGNGNSEAGAKVLDDMVAEVRKARTGKEKQAPEINTKEFIPV